MVQISNSSTYEIERGPYAKNTLIEFSIRAIDDSANENEMIDTNDGALYRIVVEETEKGGFSFIDLITIATSLIFIQVTIILRKRRRKNHA